MIFKQWEAIRDGKKTQTRRPIKPGDELIVGADIHARVVDANGRLRWREGQDYAVVPKMGKPGIVLPDGRKLRILIDHILPQLIQGISKSDAIAEYTSSTSEYRELWQACYANAPGFRWEDNPQVWVVSFVTVSRL